jgi:hypothetical protein
MSYHINSYLQEEALDRQEQTDHRLVVDEATTDITTNIPNQCTTSRKTTVSTNHFVDVVVLAAASVAL